MSDVADVVRPHPSTRGGAAGAGTVGDGDVAWLAGVGVGDEHAIA